MAKQMIFGAFGVAGVVAVLALLDLVAGFPFAGAMVLDVLFLLSAAVVGYLAYDALRDLA